MYHGIEGRLVGGDWQNWGIWNDSGGTQQSCGVAPAAAGTYEVHVYAARADRVSTYSDSRYLTVNGPPTITTQPTGQTVVIGANATFTIGATGVPTPTYQWYKNNAIIPNATSASYTFTNAQITDSGSDFSVVVTNTAGSITSNNAALTVTTNPQPPVITSALTASGTVGTVFSGYTITATNSPTSYSASGLPTGLSVNTSTGVISGTPTTANTYTVTLSATNAAGTGPTAALTFIVNPGTQQRDTTDQNQLNIHLPLTQ